MKKLLILIGGLAVVAVAWYLISPAFITVELDEESPLDAVSVTFDDSMDVMSDVEMEAFKEEIEKMAEEVVEMDDSMPTEPAVLSQAHFQPRAHDVSGQALVIETSEETILRFEDFETINGPQLKIYLSSDLGVSDAVDLGDIKATKGNVNYQIPEGVDLSVYSNVLVWCEPFKVLFSYAELQ